MQIARFPRPWHGKSGALPVIWNADADLGHHAEVVEDRLHPERQLSESDSMPPPCIQDSRVQTSKVALGILPRLTLRNRVPASASP